MATSGGRPAGCERTVDPGEQFLCGRVDDDRSGLDDPRDDRRQQLVDHGSESIPGPGEIDGIDPGRGAGDGVIGLADCGEAVVSIIGMASIADLARVVGKPVERLRFRANIYVEGTRAWEEFDWVDREIAIGGVRLKDRKSTRLNSSHT